MSVRQFRYDPNQPRVPAGAAGGGRWGGGGSSGGEIVGDSGSVLGALRSLGANERLPSRAELQAGFDPVPETDEIESTLLPHIGSDGKLTPARQAVHDDIIATAMTDKKTGKPFPRSTNKKAVVMGGGAASGKSSAIEAGFIDVPEGALTINPDEFKVVLPETTGPSNEGKQGNGLANDHPGAWASIAHEESSFLAKRLTTGALERGTNILMDKTSKDGPKAVKEIQRLQREGYEVEVAYVTTEIDQAVAGALERQKTTGRGVPESVLRDGHVGANAAFLDVASQTTARSQLVTTLPKLNGVKQAPVLTAVADGQGNLVVHDRAAWEKYLGRVPSIPTTLTLSFLQDEALAAAAGVAQGGTMSSMRKPIGDNRMKVLYGAAIAGKRPPGRMTAHETATFDKLVVEIAEMKANGISPEYDINDVFADTGIVAVTTPRAFKSVD